MTTGRKLLIGAGATLIVSMLIIAAFALGVYVGKHGWTRKGLALQGPGAPPKRPTDDPVEPGGPQPLPENDRPPDLVGRIRDIFDGTLTLATPDGPCTVEMDADTIVESPGGRVRTRGDVTHGQLVAIFGHRTGDGHVLLAERIVLLPPSEGAPARPPEKPPLKKP